MGYPIGHFDHGMQLGVEVLYAGVLGDKTTKLEPGATEGITRLGGTILGTSRTNVFKEENGLERVQASLAKLGPDSTTMARSAPRRSNSSGTGARSRTRGRRTSIRSTRSIPRRASSCRGDRSLIGV